MRRPCLSLAATVAAISVLNDAAPVNCFQTNCGGRTPLSASARRLRSPSSRGSGSRRELGSSSDNGDDSIGLPPLSPLDRIRASAPARTGGEAPQLSIQGETLTRILLPSLASSLGAFLLFPPMALGLSYLINDSATFAVLSVDSSQFVQNYLTITGLTFSILVGQTYYFMYQQQEAVFMSLFGEVAEAKSLLEQVALVCQGRRDMYGTCLAAIREYVDDDLKRGLSVDPAKVLSARPMDDPLEIITYLTSVGVPSSIYDTVRSLRQARAARLGALQRKLPPVHLLLLWLLALIELSSFPVLGAGTQTIGGYNILTIEGALFATMAFGIVLTLNVVGELYVGSGGAYNVDEVLSVMVKGLDEELDTRMKNIDEDVMSTNRAGLLESQAIEMRRSEVLPSPDYYPLRYSSSIGGQDSIEANSI